MYGGRKKRDASDPEIDGPSDDNDEPIEPVAEWTCTVQEYIDDYDHHRFQWGLYRNNEVVKSGSGHESLESAIAGAKAAKKIILARERTYPVFSYTLDD